MRLDLTPLALLAGLAAVAIFVCLAVGGIVDRSFLYWGLALTALALTAMGRVIALPASRQPPG